MKILKSWLKDYVEVEQSDEQLDDLLTFSGTLVEEVTGGIDPKIITAKILEINPHPNADRLRLVKITDGKEETSVVCGGVNIEVGQIVPFAQIGAKIGDLNIEEVEIRGEKSSGMLCSQRELGLGDDHSGIYILPDDCKLGKPLSDIIGDDSVFNLEITPNRGDCLSHLGVAREVAALTARKLKFDQEEFAKNEKQLGQLKIEIQNPQNCSRYCAAVISRVKIAPSPDWLKRRLEKVGLKSINNIVDITNFIMMDLGQPLHAFDKDKIVGETIIVRDAQDGEKITTIDQAERTLDREMLVIADSRSAVAVAGVMGGSNSAIDDNTVNIVLESAVFDRRSVRRTAKILGFTTDASYRFERGIDAELTKTALLKAAGMIAELSGGEISETIFDTAREEKNEYVKIEYKNINTLLGLELDDAQIDQHLRSLGFEIKDGMALAPSWRHDVFIWQDLAEEVARLHGLKNIPMVEMAKVSAPKTADYYFKEMTKDILVEEGFSEVFTYPFLSDSDIATIGLSPDDLLEVANPVQSENRYMRNSLIPGLMRSFAKNPTFDPIAIFEVGNVFSTQNESSKIAVAVSGKDAKNLIDKSVESLSSKTGLSKDLFIVKDFTRDDLTKYKIKKPTVYVLEMDLAILVKAMREKGIGADLLLPSKEISYREISKFPPVKRDLAFVVKNEILKEDIIKEIKLISEKVILVEPFDEFVSDKFGEGSKSVAFHIWLEDRAKTLSDQQADEQISKIIKSLEEKFEAKLR